MYRLVVSELAHEDLRNIISYIKSNLSAPEAALSFVDQVKQCYSYLKSTPLMYAVCNDGRLEKEGYRKALIKKYVLIFKVDEVKKVVNVHRFFYGHENYPDKI